MATLDELTEKLKESQKQGNRRLDYDSEEELGAIPKGNRRAVVVKWLKKGQDAWVDVRTYFYDPNSRGWRPTPKGLRLTVGQLTELLDLLKEAGLA